jgi:hypothetical protein
MFHHKGQGKPCLYRGKKIISTFSKIFRYLFMSDSQNDNFMSDDAIIGAKVTTSKAVKRRDKAG